MSRTVLRQTGDSSYLLDYGRYLPSRHVTFCDVNCNRLENTHIRDFWDLVISPRHITRQLKSSNHFETQNKVTFIFKDSIKYRSQQLMLGRIYRGRLASSKPRNKCTMQCCYKSLECRENDRSQCIPQKDKHPQIVSQFRSCLHVLRERER